MPVVAVVHAPVSGHVRPLLPLVAALSDRGSEIVQFAPPEWESERAAAGGEFRAVPDIRIDVAEPPANPIAVAELLARGTELATPWLIEQLRKIGAEIVLRDVFVGRYAALQARVPQVAFSPMMAVHRGIRPSLRSAPVALGVLVAGTPSALRLRHISRRIGSALRCAAGQLARRARWEIRLHDPHRYLARASDTARGSGGRGRAVCRAASRGEPAGRPTGARAGRGQRGRGARVCLARDDVREPSRVLSRCGECALAGPDAESSFRSDGSHHRRSESCQRASQRTLTSTSSPCSPDPACSSPTVGSTACKRRSSPGSRCSSSPKCRSRPSTRLASVELDAGLRLRRATPRQITAKTDLILTDRRFRDAAIRAGTELRSAVDLDGAVTAVLSAREAHP